MKKEFIVKYKNHNLSRWSVFTFYAMLLSMMCCFLTGCAVEEGRICIKEGRLYGKHDGLFKAKWYNYYLRGLSYGEGSCWEDASADFIKALKKRGEDQRRARTYGLHFIDYFPNRELGISNFNLGKFKEAMQLLEASLATVETARAKFYLNRARKSWLKETRLDATQPDISVQFPPPVYKTNDFSISVRGTAHDDFFISNIIFDGKSSRLELSQKKVSFEREFPLEHGKNVITLQAKDILGKASVPVTLRVEADREGPLVFLEAQGKKGNTVTITGAVYDKSTIARIILNDRELVFEETQLMNVAEQLAVHNLPEDEHYIKFEAEDVIGNKTTGRIQISYSKKSVKIPAISLKGLRDGQAMYLNTLSVEGAVTSSKGIDDLTINGQSLLSLGENAAGISFLKLLHEKKGLPLAFSKVIKLKEGKSTITTTLADPAGKVTEKNIIITRRIPKVRQLSSRMSVAIVPFTGTAKIEESLRNYVYTFLTYAFEDQKRFNVLGRADLNRALKAQKLSREAIFDQEGAKKLSQLMGSETFLVGNISVFDKSTEISARLIDTETSMILAEKDVYWEGGLNASSKEILEEMALKFKQHLPLCEGTVMSEQSGAVTFNLGENQSIHPGMRFLAFRESDPIFDPVTGMNLGNDTETIGLLLAKEIKQNSSKADVLKKFTARGIHIGDKVISK